MEHKFKVGDRVKVLSVDIDDIGVGISIGDIGKVVGICGGIPLIYFGDHAQERAMINKQVALVPEPEPIGVVTWVRPKAENNIVNEAVRVLACTFNFISKLFKRK